MEEKVYDLIVIGAGPGGYVAALRAARLGFEVAVIERRPRLGGVCLNEGCIPSKTLLDTSEWLHTARERFEHLGIVAENVRPDLERIMERKEEVIEKLSSGIASLFKKNGITLIEGSARLLPGEEQQPRVEVDRREDGTQTLEGKRVLLATGSRATRLEALPFDDERVVDARGALAFDAIPEHLVVVGGGYIGLELGSVWRRMGARVTVIEMLPHLLPHSDRQVAERLQRLLSKQGIEFELDTKVTGLDKTEEGLRVVVEKDGESETLDCDRVLVAAGRTPLTEGLGLDEAGIECDQQGRVRVDEEFRTSREGVYAIGDLIAGPMLAHKAMAEGVALAERLAGMEPCLDYEAIPAVIYTWPEAASVGLTEEQLEERGVAYEVGRSNFAGNGRARCMDETDGFVKVLSSPESGRILGVHILGPRASELIAEAATVVAFAGSARDVALTVHAHPTLAEVFHEAGLDALGEALHG